MVHSEVKEYYQEPDTWFPQQFTQEKDGFFSLKMKNGEQIAEMEENGGT